MQRLANPASFLLLVLIISIIGAALILNNGIFYLGLGIMAWGLAIFFKVILGIFIHSFILRIKKALVASLIWGLWSAGCELLFAAFFLWKFELGSPEDVIAFGLGAGLSELLITTGSIITQSQPDQESENERGVIPLPSSYWRVLYERFFTLFGQLSSRFLIWLALMHSEILPAAIAIVAFCTLETLNAYLKEISTETEEAHRHLKFLHFNAGMSSLEVACCIFFLKF